MHRLRRHYPPQSRSADPTFRRLEPDGRPGQPRARCCLAHIHNPTAISQPSGTCIRAAPARRRRSACFCRCPLPRSRCERSWASPKECCGAQHVLGKQVITSPSPAVWQNDFSTICGATDRMTLSVASDTKIGRRSVLHGGRTMQATRVVHAGRNTVEFHVYGDGPVVIMIPSLGRRADDFSDLAVRLAAAGYTTACIEPRGVGNSLGPMENLTLHDLAGDAAALVEELGRGGSAAAVGPAIGQPVSRLLPWD